MPFISEREAQNANRDYEPGISHSDDSNFLEQGVLFPWLVDPEVSWLEYQCFVECHLDSGVVTHRPLPQSTLRTRPGSPPIPDADTLSTFNVYDPKMGSSGVPGNNNLNTRTLGVNLKSKDDFEDVPQRMAHSIYRFCLKGHAIRVGYQIPIPRLESIGGIPAVPDDDPPQRASNRLVGNNSGIPIYMAQWELWYTVAVPPKEAALPPPNLAEHIRADRAVPDGIQVPVSLPDDNTTRLPPPNNEIINNPVTPLVQGANNPNNT